MNITIVTYPRLCNFGEAVSPAGTECLPYVKLIANASLATLNFLLLPSDAPEIVPATATRPLVSPVVPASSVLINLSVWYVSLSTHAYRCNATVPSTCQSCAGGFGLQGGRCQECPAGYYSAPGDMECEACPAGTYSGVRSQQCTSCSGGFWSESAAFECEPCPAGSYCTNGMKMPCANGTYSEGKWEECQGCSAGFFAKKSIECSPCDAGYYSGVNSSACTLCPAGRFAGNPQSAACQPCAAGFFAEEGARKCLECNPGYISNEASGGCFPCDEGSYSPGPGGDYCFPCSPGTYAPGKFSSVCLNCPPGRVAEDFGSIACDACPTGFAANSTTSCERCPPGTFVLSADDDDATPATLQCMLCPAGTYSSKDGDACLPCAKGTSSQAGSPTCSLCPEGFVAEEEGSSTCSPCGDNSYASPDRTKCEPCPQLEAQQCSNGVVRFFPGYWTDINLTTSLALSDALLHECEPGACAMSPGGEPRCAPLRRGRICAFCEEGYFPSSGGGCSECMPDEAGAATFTVIIITLLCLMAVMVATSNGKRSPFMSVSRVFINWMQATATIGSFAYTVPDVVKSVLGFTNEADGLSLNSGFLQCVLPLSIFESVSSASLFFLRAMITDIFLSFCRYTYTRLFRCLPYWSPLSLCHWFYWHRNSSLRALPPAHPLRSPRRPTPPLLRTTSAALMTPQEPSRPCPHCLLLDSTKT